MNYLVTEYYKTLLVIMLGALIVACGGGGAGQVVGISGSGSPVAVTALGSVDGFGSVIINGITYETDTAEFLINGEAGTQDDLAVGHVVQINGSIDADGITAQADQVIYTANVIGPVQSVDVINYSFMALGQTVLITDDTILSGVDNLSQLLSNQLVNISGFNNSLGQLVATRIDIIESTATQQVLGALTLLDSMAMTLSINDLTVDYSNAVVDGDLTLGATLQVNGSIDDSGIFIASSVSVADLVLDQTKALIDIEGLVTEFTSSADFALNGVNILSDENTVYENGSADDVNLNARLQVKAVFNDEGVLVAETVIIIYTGPVLINSTIQKGERLVYMITSTDEDIGLWSSLVYDEDEYVVLSIDTDRERTYRDNPDCNSWVGPDNNSRYCYLDNTEATTWYISIEYPEQDAIAEEVNFRLSSYLRRLPVAPPIMVSDGMVISDTLFAGDRRAYQLPTGPEGTFSVLTLNTDTEDFYLYTKDDEYPIRSRFTRVCNIRAAFFNGDQVCRLPNDGVENWYIIIEAGSDTQYSIGIDYIEPTLLDNSVPISGSITRQTGEMYRFDSTADDKTVAALLSNISGSVDLSLDDNINTNADRCYTFHSDKDQQCLEDNDGAKPWYIITTGDIGDSYTLSAISQTQTPITQAIDDGYSDNNTHIAAERTIYTIPPGPEGSIMSATLTNTTTGFDLYMNPDQITSNYKRGSCQHLGAESDYRDCRLTNTADVDQWNIVVESAQAGSYTFNAGYQIPQLLTRDIPTVGTTSTALGDLYRIPTDASVGRFVFSIENQSGPVNLVVSVKNAPYGRQVSCNLRDKISPTNCSLPSQNYYDGSYQDFYILVTADAGTSYTLTVTTEEL